MATPLDLFLVSLLRLALLSSRPFHLNVNALAAWPIADQVWYSRMAAERLVDPHDKPTLDGEIFSDLVLDLLLIHFILSPTSVHEIPGPALV